MGWRPTNADSQLAGDLTLSRHIPQLRSRITIILQFEMLTFDEFCNKLRQLNERSSTSELNCINLANPPSSGQFEMLSFDEFCNRLRQLNERSSTSEINCINLANPPSSGAPRPGVLTCSETKRGVEVTPESASLPSGISSATKTDEKPDGGPSEILSSEGQIAPEAKRHNINKKLKIITNPKTGSQSLVIAERIRKNVKRTTCVKMISGSAHSRQAGKFHTEPSPTDNNVI
ncbi:Hypothetical predicted protein [Cloeon dipterum]|uniref:Uncharacterized protein n=1 Tax=Cloeon dipterum TaxID=197152 RepID=A0A8S1DCW2_9INSE|nr:Hypothetical predicted protein [Cloeon dipterum]